MKAARKHPGAEAAAAKGWIAAHRWLILRRISQTLVLAAFLAGPLGGLWIVKGSLASSLTLGVLPLSDPYMLVQSFVAGHAIGATALTGGLILAAFYLLVGGRAYCAWVCPVNVITDAAQWTRRRLGLVGGLRLKRTTRLWVLAMTLAVAFATGTIAWELVNPVTIVFRGLVFGLGLAWAVALAVFLFDLFVADHGWCGHLCPVGAFYGLIGAGALIRINAVRRADCNDCADCYAVCPEPHVIKPALKGTNGHGPVILARDCTNCGRCMDVCALDVFAFGPRFGPRAGGLDPVEHGPHGAH